jgi:hypothetical protein
MDAVIWSAKKSCFFAVPSASRHACTWLNRANLGDESRIDLCQVIAAEQRRIARNFGG